MSRFSSFVVVATLIILGKLTGFLKDIVLTFYHGVSTVTDSYFLANSLASLIYIALYMAVPVMIVPRYAQLRRRLPPAEVDRNLSPLFVFLTCSSFGVGVAVAILAPDMLEIVAANSEMIVRDRSATYVKIMAMTFALSTAVAFYNAIQTVNGVTTPSYVVPLINNSVFCVGLFLFPSPDEFSRVLLLGIVAWILLTVTNSLAVKSFFRFRVRGLSGLLPDRAFVLLLLPAVMSFYVEQANNFVGTYFSTRLETGAISVLGYSHKLSMVILSVFLVYLTASLFPRIANLTSSGMSDGLSGFLSRTLRVVVLVATPAIAYTLYYASEVVGVLFERGSFTRENTLQVASVFSILLVAIPFTLVRDIMNRVFFSFSDTKTPVMVTTGAFVINVAMCFWFHMRLGLTGIALSISASTMVNSIAIAWLAQRRVEVPFLNSVASAGLAAVVAASISFVLLYALDREFGAFWLVLWLPFIISYLLILRVMGIEEVSQIFGSVRSLFGGKSN